MELTAHASYSELHYDIHSRRTKSGLEVDFVLGSGFGPMVDGHGNETSVRQGSKAPNPR